MSPDCAARSAADWLDGPRSWLVVDNAGHSSSKLPPPVQGQCFTLALVERSTSAATLIAFYVESGRCSLSPNSNLLGQSGERRVSR